MPTLEEVKQQPETKFLKWWTRKICFCESQKVSPRVHQAAADYVKDLDVCFGRKWMWKNDDIEFGTKIQAKFRTWGTPMIVDASVPNAAVYMTVKGSHFERDERERDSWRDAMANYHMWCLTKLEPVGLNTRHNYIKTAIIPIWEDHSGYVQHWHYLRLDIDPKETVENRLSFQEPFFYNLNSNGAGHIKVTIDKEKQRAQLARGWTCPEITIDLYAFTEQKPVNAKGWSNMMAGRQVGYDLVMCGLWHEPKIAKFFFWDWCTISKNSIACQAEPELRNQSMQTENERLTEGKFASEWWRVLREGRTAPFFVREIDEIATNEKAVQVAAGIEQIEKCTQTIVTGGDYLLTGDLCILATKAASLAASHLGWTPGESLKQLAVRTIMVEACDCSTVHEAYPNLMHWLPKYPKYISEEIAALTQIKLSIKDKIFEAVGNMTEDVWCEGREPDGKKICHLVLMPAKENCSFKIPWPKIYGYEVYEQQDLVRIAKCIAFASSNITDTVLSGYHLTLTVFPAFYSFRERMEAMKQLNSRDSNVGIYRRHLDPVGQSVAPKKKECSEYDTSLLIGYDFSMADGKAKPEEGEDKFAKAIGSKSDKGKGSKAVQSVTQAVPKGEPALHDDDPSPPTSALQWLGWMHIHYSRLIPPEVHVELMELVVLHGGRSSEAKQRAAAAPQPPPPRPAEPEPMREEEPQPIPSTSGNVGKFQEMFEFVQALEQFKANGRGGYHRGRGRGGYRGGRGYNYYNGGNNNHYEPY